MVRRPNPRADPANSGVRTVRRPNPRADPTGAGVKRSAGGVGPASTPLPTQPIGRQNGGSTGVGPASTPQPTNRSGVRTVGQLASVQPQPRSRPTDRAS